MCTGESNPQKDGSRTMGSSRSRKNSYYALKNSSVQMMEEEDVEENGEFVLMCDLCYVRRLTQEVGEIRSLWSFMRWFEGGEGCRRRL